MKLTRSKQPFTIDDVPVYGSVGCSFSSTKDFNTLEAFDFCREKGLFLQSAGLSVVARKSFFDYAKGDKKVDLDRSNDYQKLGTLALGLYDGSNIVRVFAEIDSSEESREIIRKGLEAHVAGEELFLPVTDVLIAKMLEIGRRTSPLENNSVSCSVKEKIGGSDYSKNDFNIALFGSQDFSEVNASYLRARRKKLGLSYDYTREELEKLLEGKEGMVHVRSCSLGGNSCGSIDCVDASDDFRNSGRARGFTCVEKTN